MSNDESIRRGHLRLANLSVFKKSRPGSMVRYGKGQAPDKEGSVMFADFMIAQTWLAAMDEMMRQGTSAQIARVTDAFLPMKWFDLAALQRAYDGAA